MRLNYTLESLSISSETKGVHHLTVFGSEGRYTYYIDNLVTLKREATCRRSYKTFGGCQKAGRRALAKLVGDV